MDQQQVKIDTANLWSHNLMERFFAWLQRLGVVGALVASLSLSACKATEKEEQVGVGLTGLDHLAEHLSIQEFSVNGTNGHQAGRGGRKVCCVNLPAKWRPGLTLKVRWGVTNWTRRGFTVYERDVPVDQYDTAGSMYVHFLPDGRVQILAVDAYPEKPGYPGPSYDTVLRKQPWKDFKRKPDEPEFTEIANAMEDK